MRVAVDRDRCEANGVCAGLAPEVFDLDDEDYLHILSAEVPRPWPARSAARSSPARNRPSAWRVNAGRTWPRNGGWPWAARWPERRAARARWPGRRGKEGGPVR